MGMRWRRISRGTGSGRGDSSWVRCVFGFSVHCFLYSLSYVPNVPFLIVIHCLYMLSSLHFTLDTICKALSSLYEGHRNISTNLYIATSPSNNALV